MEPVAHLHKDFPRIQEVRSAKGKAIVEQNAPVGHVKALDAHGESLPKLFPRERSKVVCGCRWSPGLPGEGLPLVKPEA